MVEAKEGEKYQKATCRDCVYYAESKRFQHPKAKIETYFSICKYSRRLMCRQYGLKICTRFKSKGKET